VIERISRRRESGETLIELLVAVIVLGIAGVGLVSGLTTGVIGSDTHRRLSTGETVLRAYGELVKNQVIHAPSTTLTQDLTTYSNGNCPSNVTTSGSNCVIPVASTAAFAQSGTYTISIDGVLWSATVNDSTSFTASPLGAGSAASGASVQRFEACPTSSYWAGVATAHTELTTVDGLQAPVVAGVTFYDYSNNPIATCSSWYNAPGNSICSNTSNQWTRCEPPWMSVALSVTSTDSKVTRTTNVIIRRVP
jgi:type II secretory pathway pseudopilin PulG